MPNSISETSFKLQDDVSLAPLTTLKIGGPARFFVQAETEEQVIEAFDFAESKALDLFVLGGGSNILVSDAGFNGLVLQIALKGMSEPPASAGGRQTRVCATPPEFGKVDKSHGAIPAADAGGSDLFHITANAGEDWDEFVEFCVAQNLAGVECLSGIPGFVGGTPVQNVGAYGQEVSETIISVRCFDRQTKRLLELSNADCGFSYRKSIFNTTERDRYIVLSVRYAVEQNGEPKIAYKDLREIFGTRQPSLKETRDAVLRIRRAKSMVIDPADPNSRSAGSFFKNPVVHKSVLGQIASDSGFETVPHFPVDEENIKIPAAWLIERAGFYKGFRLGNAGISTNHSLAIVNFGGATAQEILDLKDRIQTAVFRQFGIELVPEPVFVGF